MGIRELELIDIEAEELPKRKTDRRRAGKVKKAREIEEWPMETWVATGRASRYAHERGSGREADEWIGVQAEDEWEEDEWEEGEWTGDEWIDGQAGDEREEGEWTDGQAGDKWEADEWTDSRAENEWEADEWTDEQGEDEWEVLERPAARYRVKGHPAARRQMEGYPTTRRRKVKRLEAESRMEEYPMAKRQKEKRQTAKQQTEERLEVESPRVQEKKRRRKRRKRRVRIVRGIITAFTFTMVVGALLGAVWLAVYVYTELTEKEEVQTIATVDVEEMPNQDIREWGRFYALELERPELAVDLLTVNEYSRPGEALPEVKNIFIHYTANAGTTAEQNRSYFESLSKSHERSASAHFVIGYDGTVVQCIPTKEIAYAVKGRNYDSLSIECCYLKENGKFEEETYRSLIELTAWLLHKYELRPENVLRHYDEGGKNCPKYYVEHEEAWRNFLMDLASYMESLCES